jgi:mediator of RNA polymerase II transcription subunit 7
MQTQLDNKRAETAAIRSVVDKARRVLEGLGSIEVPGSSGDGGGGSAKGPATAGDQEAMRPGRESASWASMDSDFA